MYKKEVTNYKSLVQKIGGCFYRKSNRRVDV